MSLALLIPIKVFGFGFLISMGIAFLIKLILDTIKLITEKTSKVS